MDCTFRYDAALSGPPPRVSPFTHAKVLLMATIGGVMGIVGAAFSGSPGGFLLAIFLGAPVIEEAFKPIGVYISLVRWPQALRSRLHVALLCGLSGLVFGLIESSAYVFLYFPDHPEWYAWFRFLVNAPLHAAFSFTVGLGLSARTVDWLTRGAKLPRRTLYFYLAGVGMHATWNTSTTILAVIGVFDF